MSARRRISTTERVNIFMVASGVCHICDERIGLSERWDIDHVIPLEMGGDEVKGSTNLQPAHVACHRTKTTVDVWRIAKAKRVEAKHIGARPRSALSHPTLKRKFDGSVVPR